MALSGGGSWNGNVMSAFSRNRRRILSLWLPRLPTDRIQRQLGRTTAAPANINNAPCIVVAKQNNTLPIFALDDAAAHLGLEVGLPLANARAVCPHVRVFDADETADTRTLNDIADWCDRFTPLVALDPPHGLFLDITGCAHLFGGEAALMQTICAALTRQGFAVSAGIAGTSICARTMTRYVSGQIIREGEESDAVRPLPVFALLADTAITRGLRRAGLKTIGDVASRARHEITAMERQGKGARRLEASFFRTDGAVRAITLDTGQPVTKPTMIERLFRER